MLPASWEYYGRKLGTRGKVLPKRSGVLSLIQFLRAVYEKNAKNQKKCEKNVKHTPVGVMPRTPPPPEDTSGINLVYPDTQ